jgi:glycosyltransferase involved in cell wall biosynthesis
MPASLQVLWICPIAPIPVTGTGTREYNIIKYFPPGFEFTLLSILKPEQRGDLRKIEQYVGNIFTLPWEAYQPPKGLIGIWQNRVNAWSQTLLRRDPNYLHVFPIKQLRQTLLTVLKQNKFDLVHIVGLYGAGLIDAVKPLPTVFTAIDVESSKQAMIARRERALSRRFQWWLELRKLTAFERSMFGRFDAVLAMSIEDQALIKQLSPGCKTRVVPNGVDVAYYRPNSDSMRSSNKVLFFGNLGYTPNIDAIVYFCNEIWPLIHAQLPSACLEIIGPFATDVIKQLESVSSNVVYAGFVEDLRPFLWSAAVCVVPLRMGGGTRLKILEAMAARCPVVSTTLGAIGLGLGPERDLLIGDTPEEFARQVLSILRSPEQGQSLSFSAWQCVADRYDWTKIASIQADVYRSLL